MCISWLDNWQKWLNFADERREKMGDAEKNAVTMGYLVPPRESGRVPARIPVPGWYALPPGTPLSNAPPWYICVSDDEVWFGVTTSELCAGTHLCNRPFRFLPAEALRGGAFGLCWEGPFDGETALASLAPWLVSILQETRCPFSLVPERVAARCLRVESIRRALVAVERGYGAHKGCLRDVPLPGLPRRWVEVDALSNGRLSDPHWSTDYFGRKQRAQLMNPSLFTDGGASVVPVDRRYVGIQMDVKETSTAGSLLAHIALQQALRPSMAEAPSAPAGPMVVCSTGHCRLSHGGASSSAAW